jgi:hypothetical protein
LESCFHQQSSSNYSPSLCMELVHPSQKPYLKTISNGKISLNITHYSALLGICE